jgi:hypothetical protein
MLLLLRGQRHLDFEMIIVAYTSILLIVIQFGIFGAHKKQVAICIHGFKMMVDAIM